MTLVASALAGGDCIDDADVLRTGQPAPWVVWSRRPPPWVPSCAVSGGGTSANWSGREFRLESRTSPSIWIRRSDLHWPRRVPERHGPAAGQEMLKGRECPLPSYRAGSHMRAERLLYPRRGRRLPPDGCPLLHHHPPAQKPAQSHRGDTRLDADLTIEVGHADTADSFITDRDGETLEPTPRSRTRYATSST